MEDISKALEELALENCQFRQEVSQFTDYNINLSENLKPVKEKETLRKTLQANSKLLEELTPENNSLQQRIRHLEEENINLREHMFSLEERIEFNERENRRCNIFIRGLPDKFCIETASNPEGKPVLVKRQTIRQTVCDLLNTELNVKISPDDIVTAFRLRSGSNNRIRPVIVKFKNSLLKDSVLRAKRNLQLSEKSILIFDHLTRANLELLFSARALLRQKKIHAAWTFNGQVFVKFDDDNLSKPSLIKSSVDLPS